MTEPPWTSPAWLAEARAWITGELARLGAEPAGPVEQPHVRPWATVLRVPTRSGTLWFKASLAALAHEAAVVEVLARRRPEAVPRLLAVDRERGWMLQADGGVSLRERLADGADPGVWEEVLTLYAELQADAAADVDALLAGGAPDRRLAALPALYGELVERVAGLDAGERAALAALRPRVAELAGRLASLGVPESVQHDDLHSANVLVRDGGLVLFDWGDACVSHPFFSLHVTLRVLAWELGLEAGSRALDRFRDAYLEPWTRLAPPAELAAAVEPADALGGLCRALGWERILAEVPPGTAAGWHDAVVDRLRTFLAGAA